jgi:hypothetical protein
MYKVEVFIRSRRAILGSFLFSVLFAVMQLSAFATGSVTLAWDASTDPIVAGYNVYYGGASGAYTNEISVGNATSATISGLVEGTTYYFAATTYAASGMESSFSSEISYLVPMNAPIVNQPPTLDPISNLTTNENAGLQTVNLSGITSGAANENNQTLTVTATSGNKGLIPNPTVNYTSANTTGNLTFTPAANASGTATVTVVVHDNGGTANGGIDSVTNTFTVTVNAVNQAPTLNTISNLTTNENAGLQTVNLSGITSSGAANENNQTLTVTATSGNKGLIPNPTVNYTSANTTGNLTFTPAANASGTATVTVVVHDNGGTANGGVDSVTNTFTVTVNAVNTSSTNQPPTLDPISNLTTNENAGLQTVGLCGITCGSTNESQTLTVTAISSNPGLIPTPMVNYTNVNSTGKLTFTPAANAFGTATITVVVHDNGGTANGGVDSVTNTFTVTVNAVNTSSTNQPPTLDPIPNIIVNVGASSQKIILTGICSGTTNPCRRLRVTAASSNHQLASRPLIRYISPKANGTLIFRPGRTTGTATISVTVNNGARSNNIITRTFTVTIAPRSARTSLAASTAVTTRVANNTGTPGMMDPSQIATTLAPAAHVSGQFALTVAGASGHQYVVEASTDLMHWVPVQTNTAPFLFVDTNASQFGQRFYRSVYVPRLTE